jgi:hypothetical protein
MDRNMVSRFFSIGGNTGVMSLLLIIFGSFFSFIGLMSLLAGYVSEATLIFMLPGMTMLTIGISTQKKNGRFQFVGEQLDALFDSLESAALEAAFYKLGVDKTQVSAIEPLVVSGYVFNNLPPMTEAKLDARTGRWRSPMGEVAIILFSEDMLYSYKRTFSFIDPDFKAEETDEYFYKDVVSIATKAEVQEVRVGRNTQSIRYESITLSNSGGNAVKCALYDTGSVERSLGAARNLIREKKR